jgi:hypothetical protein
MMEKVELNAVRILAAAIKDSRNLQAQREAISMRDRWLVEAKAGMLHINADARKALEETRGPTDDEIRRLKADGFVVHQIVDTDRPVYAWLRPSSGESQRDVKEQQPYRSTEKQAWDDCRDYATLNFPLVRKSDWSGD